MNQKKNNVPPSTQKVVSKLKSIFSIKSTIYIHYKESEKKAFGNSLQL